jgi:endoglucanase
MVTIMILSARKIKIALLLIAAFATLSFGQQMRDISTMQLVRDMGLGINLGNTFEARIVCDPGDNGCEDWIKDMETFETTWGSPSITGAMIKGYADAGFKTVRVPVAWSNRMTGDSPGGTYTISPALLNRVQEIVDMVLANGMYANINIHWDGGWWEKFPTDSAECMRKYTRIWEQVSGRFKDYGDRLIFASLNEEGGWDDVWYIWRNGDDLAAKARSYGILKAINQQFVNTVRASGGNNADRHLQIQGYHTDIDRTVDDMFSMPSDPRSGGARLAVSVHYYDPFGFTHLSQSESWATMTRTWGTEDEINHLNSQMDKMKTSFVDKGIPVIIGEYGYACSDIRPPRDMAEVRKYTLAVTKAIYDRQMAPILWDVQLNESNGEVIYYYNRHTQALADPLFKSGLAEIAGDNIAASARDRAVISNSKTAARPSVSVKGKTLTVNAPFDTKVGIRVVDMRGKTVAKFNAQGGSTLSLKKIPAGSYIIETKMVKDGVKTVSAAVLK